MGNKLLPIFMLLFLLSCRQNEKVNVVRIHYRFDKEFTRDSLKLVISETKKSVKFVYLEPIDSIEMYQQAITSFPETDSIILYHSDTARLVDQKQYGNEIIKRYYFNREDISDDELLLFTLDKVGLVGFVELAWDGYMIFDHPGTDVEEKLREDSSSFFYWRKE